MAAVRKAADNNKKNSSLTCADAKSYLSQSASKNDTNVYVQYSAACRAECRQKQNKLQLIGRAGVYCRHLYSPPPKKENISAKDRRSCNT